MNQKDFLAIRDFSPEDIRWFLQKAIEIKADPGEYSDALSGKALAMIFEKPSLRTRVTFDVGIHELGGYSVYLSPAEISMGKREPVKDVARNLDRMVHGIVARTFSHTVVEELARYARIPVINGLSDYDHPCQALADYLTILELKKELERVKLAFIGDGNNVAHALIQGAVRLGVHLTLATPEGYEPAAEIVRWAKDHAGETGAQVDLATDPIQAVADADVVYTDVWTSMGQEEEQAERLRIFKSYQVNDALFAKAKPDAIFMHCLPAHRGEEVTDSVIDSERSAVFGQAENRLHVEKAIMLGLMS